MKFKEKVWVALGIYAFVGFVFAGMVISEYDQYTGTEKVGIMILWPLFAIKYIILGIIAGWGVLT